MRQKKKQTIFVLPHEKRFTATHGSNLMKSLMDQGIFLRSDCGGKGTCKKCRVGKILENGIHDPIETCTHLVSNDMTIEIPESSMLSSHILQKAPVSLPRVFTERFKDKKGIQEFGIAADIGTTTLALYLCDMARGRVVASIAVKNPQALYGDDVMSRISAVSQNNETLGHLQTLVVRAMEWGIEALVVSSGLMKETISRMVVVGNPVMIHILAGVDPEPIGISPYQPVFYDALTLRAKELGFKWDFLIQTLPQVSGFIGGDILGAAMAVEFENQPEATLLIDLGTNGELLLKGRDGYFATSCATGPAFEGACLSCGMQAIPGAIDRIEIRDPGNFPRYTIINPQNDAGIKPTGICGTGVISAVAQFCRNGIIDPGGAFKRNPYLPMLKQDSSGTLCCHLIQEGTEKDGTSVFISQKDIRSVQLGKAALISGIEFLLERAGIDKPEKIIIAGAFGSFIDKDDMMTLGMIPAMAPDKVETAGNSAGAGAVMVLCDASCLEKSIQMAKKINVVDLAGDQKFQKKFIEKLGFPVL